MKNLTDYQLNSGFNWVRAVIEEHKHQVRKWGVQSHTPAEWLMFTTEELGELAQAISEYEYGRVSSPKNIVKEAIQVATLAIKIAEMYSAVSKIDTEAEVSHD